MNNPLSISYQSKTEALGRVEPREKPEQKYSRPISLLWCLFSAAQLTTRAGFAVSSFVYALSKASDAGLVEYQAAWRGTKRSLVSDGDDPISTNGLFWRSALLGVVWIGVPVGATYFVGDKLGAWVWGA